MANGFLRFEKTWARLGLLVDPTDAQADAGWAFIGPTPPSVEQFNSVMQWWDEKDNWLYGQIDEVIKDAGLVSADNDLTLLLQAIQTLITSGTGSYLPLAGGTMTGNIGMGTGTTGIGYSGLGGAGNSFGFTWTTDAQLWVDGNLIGSLALQSSLGNYVAKTGDTMSGGLTVNAAIQTNSITSVGLASVGGVGINYPAVGGNYHSFNWDAVNGFLNAFVDGTFVGSLVFYGLLGNYVAKAGDVMSGGLTAPAFASTGNISAGGRVDATSVHAFGGNMGFFNGGGFNYFQWSPDWYDYWDSANGNRVWAGPGGALATLSGAGGLNCIDTISSNAAVVAATTVFAGANLQAGLDLILRNDGNYGMFDTGAGPQHERKIRWGWGDSSYVYGFNLSTSSHFWRANLIDPCVVIDGGGSFLVNTAAFKPGGGVWGDSNSDARVKQIHSEYKGGLAELITLRPVTFSFTDAFGGRFVTVPPTAERDGSESLQNDLAQAIASQQQFLGLIAQETEVAMPEMVSRHRGIINGVEVDDLRSMDKNALLYAYINAFKEVDERLRALEGATP